MYCTNCGGAVESNNAYCTACGAQINKSDNGSSGHGATKADNENYTLLKVLSFFFPLIGLIMYFVWKKAEPNKANKCFKSAIAGVAVCLALLVIAITIAIVLVIGVASELFDVLESSWPDIQHFFEVF